MLLVTEVDVDGRLLNWLPVHVYRVVHNLLRAVSADHVAVVVRSVDHCLRIGIRVEVVIHTLEVRALLQLSNIMKVMSHVDSRKLVQDCLPLDRILSYRFRMWVDFRSK